MLVKSIIIPTLASLAYAESTVTSMFIYGADTQPLAASVVSNDASATTYSINCPPGTDGSDCGMGPGLTLIANDAADKTTFIMDDGDSFHFTVKCAVTKSSATCVESAGGPDANFPGVATSTTDVSLMPVTVTAGKITSGHGSATSTATATGSPTLSSTKTTPTPSLASAAQGSGSGNSTQTASDPSETGAAAKVDGVFRVVLGGAAVALLGAVL
ncbi:hypothetical protein BDW74DRAFT_153016 [Aspergillus multicolor]|uniref:uncharacterized protein n=1 Tax=Aspergillus multicolor TaxID=41759 RepID=UPI003CCD16A3